MDVTNMSIMLASLPGDQRARKPFRAGDLGRRQGLAEITAEGTRAVDFFWSEALGWPLVLNKGEQTAIQSPDGGTKLSWDAWNGESKAARSGADRQRFELAADDLEARSTGSWGSEPGASGRPCWPIPTAPSSACAADS